KIGLTRRGGERRNHVLEGADVVDDTARLNDPWPAHHERNTPSALPVRVLLAAERRRAAIRPRHDFSAVVGGETDNRVVRDAEVVELLEKLPHVAIEFDHTVGIETKTGLADRRWFEMRPDVHPCRIEIAEPGLALVSVAV